MESREAEESKFERGSPIIISRAMITGLSFSATAPYLERRVHERARRRLPLLGAQGPRSVLVCEDVQVAAV